MEAAAILRVRNVHPTSEWEFCSGQLEAADVAEREGLLGALRLAPLGPPCGRYPASSLLLLTDRGPLEFMARLAEREGLLAATPLIPRWRSGPPSLGSGVLRRRLGGGWSNPGVRTPLAFQPNKNFRRG